MLKVRAVSLVDDPPRVVYRTTTGTATAAHSHLAEAKLALEKHLSCDLHRVGLGADEDRYVHLMARLWKDGGRVVGILQVLELLETSEDEDANNCDTSG